MCEFRIVENKVLIEIGKWCRELITLLKTSYDPISSELTLLKRVSEKLNSFGCSGSLKIELTKVVKVLLKKRFKKCSWQEHRTLIYLEFLNVFLTETSLWTVFKESDGFSIIYKLMSGATRFNNMQLQTEHTRTLLVSLTGMLICYKDVDGLLTEISQFDEIIKMLVLLMNSKDHKILENVLILLSKISKKTHLCKIIAHLNSVEILITIIDGYDILYKRLSSELLAELLNENESKQMVKICEGVCVFLRVIKDCDIETAQGIVQCLWMLSQDQELATEIKSNNGLQILLSLLHDKKYHPNSYCYLSTESNLCDELTIERLWTQYLALKSTCCGCLSELVCCDVIAFDIVQTNIIFLVSILILPSWCLQFDKSSEFNQSEISYHNIQSCSRSLSESESIFKVDIDNSGLGDAPVHIENIASFYRKMQASALKLLRFIFSIERNRSKFKKLFTPYVFEKFIDIGHYNRQNMPYEDLIEEISILDQKNLEQLRINIRRINMNKLPMKVISDYAVSDVLGSGAFGTVYKVYKVSQPQIFFAMKEVHESSSSLTSDGLNGINQLHSELNILQEKLYHHNIVQYYKSFIFDKRLYIVMEFVDGGTLEEHLISAKEKDEKMSEERIWNIFVQLVLGLRYLHKEKGIVHRDLKPNNVMLAESGKVVLTDFGLAKQKSPENSKMISVVGSILYSSPELVKNEEYGEKVDIWSLGCLLYQMCKLQPPFSGGNMLALVAKIVESKYDPIEKDSYSELLVSTVTLCLTTEQKDRPDINGVASAISVILLTHLDHAKREESYLRNKLENEINKKPCNQLQENDAFMYSQSHDSGYMASEMSPKITSHSGHLPSIQVLQKSHLLGLKTSSSGSRTEESFWTNQKKIRSHKLTPLKANSLPPLHPQSESKKIDGRNLCSLQSAYEYKPISGYEEGAIIATATAAPLNKRLSRSGILPHINSKQMQYYNLVPDMNLKYHINSKNVSPKVHSAPSINSRERGLLGEGQRMVRTTSSHIMLSSGRRNDQSYDFFVQLHKIIFITQLPPTLYYCAKRKIVEDFKRMLFQGCQSVAQAMLHIKKLVECSKEVVDMKVPASILKALKNSEEWYGDDLTYIHLKSIIDGLLEENGY